MKNSKSGELMIIGAVVCLLGSIVVSYFGAANDAQLAATAENRDVSPWEMVDSGDVVQALIATGAGAAAGWGIDQLKSDGDDKDQDVPTMQVTSGRDTVISIGGDGTTAGNEQSQPVTTSTSTTTTPEATP